MYEDVINILFFIHVCLSTNQSQNLICYLYTNVIFVLFKYCVLNTVVRSALSLSGYRDRSGFFFGLVQIHTNLDKRKPSSVLPGCTASVYTSVFSTVVS